MPSFIANKVNVFRDKQKSLRRIELTFNTTESWINDKRSHEGVSGVKLQFDCSNDVSYDSLKNSIGLIKLVKK